MLQLQRRVGVPALDQSLEQADVQVEPPAALDSQAVLLHLGPELLVIPC